MIIPAGGQDWKPDMGQASKPTSKEAKKDDGKENKAPGEKSKKQMEKEAKKAEKMAKRAAAKGDAGQVWSPNQFYSVSFLQSRNFVKMGFFATHTIKVWVIYT